MDEVGKPARHEEELGINVSHLISSLQIQNELPLPFPGNSASSKVPFAECFVPQSTKKEAMAARADADLPNTQTPIGQVAFPEVAHAESCL